MGLVGYPNAGKSTLLSVISAARPKVAAYPFTTLAPNLGVVKVEAGKSFVVADIPGLIEGAHAGVGLGHDFLRHVERTRLLVHVVDCSGMEGRDPIDDFRQIRDELGLFSAELAARPYIVVGNKLDLPEGHGNLQRLQAVVEGDILGISAATRQGIQELTYRIWQKLQTLQSQEAEAEADARIGLEAPEEPVVITIPRTSAPLEDFTVTETDDGFVVGGEGLRRLLKRHDLNNAETLRWLLRMLRDIGVIDALREAGVQDGDIVKVEEWEFEYLS